MTRCEELGHIVHSWGWHPLDEAPGWCVALAATLIRPQTRVFLELADVR
jgi:hypothetical protein